MPRDTLFSPSFGNRPRLLIGRDTLIQSLLNGLETEPGSRERAVLVLGQRGSGKTVLLLEIADRAREMGYVVASPTVASHDMLDRIIEKLQDDGERVLGRPKTHVSGGSIGAMGLSMGLQFTREVRESKSFQYKLTQICRRLHDLGQGVLILVDELQASSPEIRQLVVAYQELVGERQDIALIMAGLPGAVSSTLNDKVLTFLNRARKTRLGGLPIDEVDAAYARSLADLGLSIPSDLRREAAMATEGSPYLFQLIGHEIVVYANEDGSIDAHTLAEALATARTDFQNDVCDTTLAALSHQDVRFLRAMAEDEGPSMMVAVARRLDVSADYAQKYRKRLIDAGVIESAGRGSVRFAVPYLADALRRERDA